VRLLTGMPDPNQMPQQVMLPPEHHGDIVLDVLGVRVPASMLESGYFWAFMVVCAAIILGVAWLKYRSAAK
jgi:hypothetical protein